MSSAGKMRLPEKAEERSTMSESINSMDCGSRQARFIFGTAAMPVSRLS